MSFWHTVLAVATAHAIYDLVRMLLIGAADDQDDDDDNGEGGTYAWA